MQASFTERLEHTLAAALRRTPWKPHVKANAMRRLACWMGGASFCAMPSGQDRFVTRAEYESDPSCLHTRFGLLAHDPN